MFGIKVKEEINDFISIRFASSYEAIITSNLRLKKDFFRNLVFGDFEAKNLCSTSFKFRITSRPALEH